MSLTRLFLRVEHDRLQATIHMMSGMMAYEVGSPSHSLIISSINEHHHRVCTTVPGLEFRRQIMLKDSNTIPSPYRSSK